MKEGNCEILSEFELKKENYFGAIAAIKGTSKEMDCKQEGWYYETKGYRKIPGDVCYDGVDLDLTRIPCGPMSFIGDIVYAGAWKNLIIFIILVTILYYGWPFIE